MYLLLRLTVSVHTLSIAMAIRSRSKVLDVFVFEISLPRLDPLSADGPLLVI